MIDGSIQRIDAWYQSMCDGRWEHIHGITLETSDNPGWIATIHLRVSRDSMAIILNELLSKYNAQVGFDDASVRIFAPKLNDCLAAMAVVIDSQSDTTT